MHTLEKGEQCRTSIIFHLSRLLTVPLSRNISIRSISLLRRLVGSPFITHHQPLSGNAFP